MRQTKKVTLSAAVVALSILFLVLGAFVDVLDLSACALASLLVVFVYIEIGSPYTYLVWLATSLTAFLFLSGNPLFPFQKPNRQRVRYLAQRYSEFFR